GLCACSATLRIPPPATRPRVVLAYIPVVARFGLLITLWCVRDGLRGFRDGGGPTQAFRAHQIVTTRNQLDPSDTPRLIRLRRARSVGVIPSIRRKVRVRCAPSENPAL